MLTDRQVLDSLSTGVLVAGSDEVTRHANPAACRMLGRDVQACIDQPVPLLLGMSVGSSRVDLQACKLEYSIVSPK